ncbi:hypothetical protein [Enterobacter roggenkampii]|uniref:hypothetical protein n=1 Tax=Enterobacter roggenkampii TaxID=1812935 RepID=UPI001C701A3C|nr:hypothetical protein [Enterobacter roggenkampii]MBW9442012.1 hypothetical protein [Enterobacter roggenkampii]
MLDLNVSTLKNTVTFVVDRQSIAEAKAAADNLQKHFQKIADPKIRFQAQKQRRQKARQQADDARFNDKPRDTKEMKAQRAAEKQKARDERANLRAQQQIQKRQETAELKLRHAGLQISGIKGKYGLDAKQQYEALRFIQKQSEEFAKGNISSQRMNALIRERVTLLRREAAQQVKVTQAQRTQYAATAEKLRSPKATHSPMMGGMLGSAVLAAGSMGVGQRIIDKGNENLELVRMSERVRTNPNVIKAMVAWGQQNGVDSANVDKATDNMKDVRERLANTVTNASLDPISGKWKGGDGGVNTIMNQFGWNKADISKYQDNPIDFIQSTVNEGQRRGMSQAQIGNLIESLGDDLMHYTDMFMNNGEQFTSTLKKLVESGQTLNDEQIRQTLAYGDLSVAMGNLINGSDNQLFTGFMKGFADSGDELVKNTQAINQSAGLLGEGLGNLASQMTGFVSEISGVVSDLNSALRSRYPEWFSDTKKPAVQNLYDGAVGGSANATADWIQDKTGFDTRSVAPAIKSWLGIGDQQAGTAASGYGLNGEVLRNSAMSLNSANVPAYNLSPIFNLTVEPTVPLTIQSDTSRLADYVDFQARASQASFTQSLTLQMSSGQSSTGG